MVQKGWSERPGVAASSRDPRVPSGRKAAGVCSLGLASWFRPSLQRQPCALGNGLPRALPTSSPLTHQHVTEQLLFVGKLEPLVPGVLDGYANLSDASREAQLQIHVLKHSDSRRKLGLRQCSWFCKHVA